MGGYFAVAISDFIRGIVEFVGVLVMVLLLAGHERRPRSRAFTALLDPKHMPALHRPRRRPAMPVVSGLGDACGRWC